MTKETEVAEVTAESILIARIRELEQDNQELVDENRQLYGELSALNEQVNELDQENHDLSAALGDKTHELDCMTGNYETQRHINLQNAEARGSSWKDRALDAEKRNGELVNHAQVLSAKVDELDRQAAEDRKREAEWEEWAKAAERRCAELQLVAYAMWGQLQMGDGAPLPFEQLIWGYLVGEEE